MAELKLKCPLKNINAKNAIVIIIHPSNEDFPLKFLHSQIVGSSIRDEQLKTCRFETGLITWRKP